MSEGEARAVWRRPSSSSQPVSEEPLFCGGNQTRKQRFEEMRERRRLRKEAEEKERGEARRSSRGRAGKDGDNGDDDTAKARDKRYAVELLQQETAAWGRSSTGPGDIG